MNWEGSSSETAMSQDKREVTAKSDKQACVHCVPLNVVDASTIAILNQSDIRVMLL